MLVVKTDSRSDDSMVARMALTSVANWVGSSVAQLALWTGAKWDPIKVVSKEASMAELKAADLDAMRAGL